MINTPFGANLASSLILNQGFVLNPITSALVGSSTTVSTYTPGSLITDTCLNSLTNAIQAGYQTLGVYLDEPTYSNLISIGSSSIPALGNSKPPTFTWIGPANAEDTTSTDAQAISWYPYIATSTTNTYPLTNPSPIQWSNLTSTTYSPDITQWGWVRLFALQAWNEFNYNNTPTASSVSYKDFLSSFQTCAGFLESNNNSINSLANAQTFLKNTYSNNNDLMTSDITGVNLATNEFGLDLIATGKAIDLTTIESFGLPSNLLKTLQKYNALTSSLVYAILAAGLTTSGLNDILNNKTPATKLQEQQLYAAFSVIVGDDLANILIPLNCGTKGITSLIDLLNPQKLFPNSYASLTVPVYNSGPGPTNAKTYYPIYSNGGVNSQITNPVISKIIGSVVPAPISKNTTNLGTNFQVPPIGFGSYTKGIIPDDISTAAGAFSYAMQQINNIKNVNIEKFAQVVTNLETTKGLPQTQGTNTPANTTLISNAISQMAYGSGVNGTYTMSDFFGSMSGLPYQWNDIKKLVLQLQTHALITIYNNIYSTIQSATVDVSTTVQSLIDSANAEINSILSKNPDTAQNLNRMWNLTGTQLTIEQRARNIALVPVPVPRTNSISQFPTAITSYVNALDSYSKRTEPNMHSQTIEAISDLSTPGGQSQVAQMRATRNKDKLAKVGIAPYDDIPTEPTPLTIKILMANGTTSIGATNQGIPAGNATFTIPANQEITGAQPQGYFDPVTNCYEVASMHSSSVLGSIPDNANLGQDLAGPNITQVPNPITPISGGSLPNSTGSRLPLGQPIVPGSLAGNPYQNLIPPQLSVPFTSGILSPSTYNVPEAIDEVIRCNCDCWLN
jgi:hypothetical protein